MITPSYIYIIRVIYKLMQPSNYIAKCKLSIWLSLSQRSCQERIAHAEICIIYIGKWLYILYPEYCSFLPRHQRNKAATEVRFMRLGLYLNRKEVDEEEAEMKRTWTCPFLGRPNKELTAGVAFLASVIMRKSGAPERDKWRWPRKVNWIISAQIHSYFWLPDYYGQFSVFWK